MNICYQFAAVPPTEATLLQKLRLLPLHIASLEVQWLPALLQGQFDSLHLTCIPKAHPCSPSPTELPYQQLHEMKNLESGL